MLQLAKRQVKIHNKNRAVSLPYMPTEQLVNTCTFVAKKNSSIQRSPFRHWIATVATAEPLVGTLHGHSKTKFVQIFWGKHYYKQWFSIDGD